MELVTNIVNVKPSQAFSHDIVNKKTEMLMQRIRTANASMQRDLAAAHKKMESTLKDKSYSADQMAYVNEQLAEARKVIATLESKVKFLTASLNEAVSKKNFKGNKRSEQEQVQATEDTRNN